MLEALSRFWWLVVLRGVFAIIFGILAFLWPGITIGALIILFGAYALVDGISTIITAISRRKSNSQWWVLLLEGIIGVVAGILAFVYPGMTALALLYFIAVWAILTGIMEIAAAIRLRKEIDNEWMMALGGVASIILGVLLLIFPGSGALGLLWVIAAYSIIFGILLIILGLRLRGARGMMRVA